VQEYEAIIGRVDYWGTLASPPEIGCGIVVVMKAGVAGVEVPSNTPPMSVSWRGDKLSAPCQQHRHHSSTDYMFDVLLNHEVY